LARLHLLADIGSTFTKLCLVDPEAPAVLGAAAAPTTVTTDVNRGLDEALARLGPAARGAVRTLAASSAAGGLRIAAVGLVPELTMKAARLAALGAGGKVVAAFSFRLTASDETRLREVAPDLVLLAGGTDGGDSAHIVHNARRLAGCLPDVPLVVAGNRQAQDEIAAVLSGRPGVRFTDNVMPEVRRLDLAPARECIRAVFLERIVFAKGLDELMAVDMGGATTDVYSCADGRPCSPRVFLRGLPEPFEKRTVEADVGLRHTLPFLLEGLDLAALAARAGCAAEDVTAWAAAVRAEPGRLPSAGREERIDAALAAAGLALAAERHCGRLEETFTPEGRAFVQEGKDLSRVRLVVGSGGPLAVAREPGKLLAGFRREAGSPVLKPEAPEFLVDRSYLLWAMGLLAGSEPAAALALMRKHLVPA
jgi:hypothetical protein